MGGTFKPAPQFKLEIPARTERHMFFQQMRFSYDSNWGAAVRIVFTTNIPIFYAYEFNLTKRIK